MAAAAAVLAVGACVGATDRDDFTAAARTRGGGLDGGLVAAAVDAVEDDLGVDGIRVRAMTVGFGYVTLEVQVPSDPDELDAYRFGASARFGGDGLGDPSPVTRHAHEPPLDSEVFEPGAAGIDRFDGMVAAALEAADLRGGYASGASIRRPAADGGDPLTSVTVTNDRRTVVVTFAADGSLLEAVSR
jgi:hypothetical protein